MTSKSTPIETNTFGFFKKLELPKLEPNPQLVHLFIVMFVAKGQDIIDFHYQHAGKLTSMKELEKTGIHP